jgi:hypothetical protein
LRKISFGASFVIVSSLLGCAASVHWTRPDKDGIEPCSQRPNFSCQFLNYCEKLPKFALKRRNKSTRQNNTDLVKGTQSYKEHLVENKMHRLPTYPQLE